MTLKVDAGGGLALFFFSENLTNVHVHKGNSKQLYGNHDSAHHLSSFIQEPLVFAPNTRYVYRYIQHFFSLSKLICHEMLHVQLVLVEE